MELFIPGILLFLLAIAVSFIFIPRFTPLVIAILSIIFLTKGVYDHYKMFASEYRLSTWQDGLKIYAPAIMIGSIIIFILYAILAFFTKGSVPVPSIPNIIAPGENSVTNQVVQSLNKIANTVNDTKNDIIESANNAINSINTNRNNILNAAGKNNNANKNKNKNENNLSRSFLETI